MARGVFSSLISPRFRFFLFCFLPAQQNSSSTAQQWQRERERAMSSTSIKVWTRSNSVIVVFALITKTKQLTRLGSTTFFLWGECCLLFSCRDTAKPSSSSAMSFCSRYVRACCLLLGPPFFFRSVKHVDSTARAFLACIGQGTCGWRESPAVLGRAVPAAGQRKPHCRNLDRAQSRRRCAAGGA